MSDTSLAFNFLKGRDTATPHMRTVGDSATTMASRIKASSVLSVAATATMVAGWASLAAQGVAAVAAVSPLLGLVATVPALGIAAAGGIIPLVMAFSGLGAALKHTTGSASQTAQAIAAAEHQVEMAQRGATQAQQGLNDARVQAAARLVELTRLLAHAALNERAATLAVTDAQKQLRLARMSGDRSQVDHAQLALEESVLALEDVKLHTLDLRKEEEKRTQAGVEGSVEVKSALQQQTDAMYNLAQAQAALAKAQKGSGGVNAAAVAYAKLSTAGKQLVDVLRAIGPSWHGVQQAVQQSVFAGVAGDIKDLSTIYLPIMGNQLPEIGKGWNNAFRGVGELAKTDGFVKGVNITLGNTATFWQAIGRSFAPFLSGFMQFATVGSSFLPGIGSWIERSAKAFESWATAAAETGRAQGWMQNGLTVLSQLWEITKNLGSSIASIFRAGDAGPGWLPGLVAGTQALSDFLASPAGQGKLSFVFTTLRDIGSKLWDVLTHVGPSLLDLAKSAGGTTTDTISVFGAVVGFLADNIDTLTKFMPAIIAAFVLYKTISAGAIVVETIRIPLLIAQTVSNFALAAAMRATMVATGQATTAQWGLNLAFLANPVGLIIIAIIALVAGFILLWQNSAGFRDFFIGMWDHIWGFMKAIGAWFAGPFANFFSDAWNWIIDTAKGALKFWMDLPGQLRDLFLGVTRFIAEPFVTAFNAISNAWNNTVGSLSWTVPDWVPFVGGKTIHAPKLPQLALKLGDGGVVLPQPGGVPALLAERNEAEVVAPLSKLPEIMGSAGAGGGGRQEIVVTFDVTGADEDFKRLIRNMVRVKGGKGPNSVQVAFG